MLLQASLGKAHPFIYFKKMILKLKMFNLALSLNESIWCAWCFFYLIMISVISFQPSTGNLNDFIIPVSQAKPTDR